MMDEERALPFWGRVTVVESPLDVEESKSGIVLPVGALSGDADDGKPARRGVVQAIDAEIWHEGTPERTCAEKIRVGSLVYFRNPIRLRGDLLAVDMANILAVET